MRILFIFMLFGMFGGLAKSGSILANGDFANGSAHWGSDRDTATSATTLVVRLKHDTWSKVYQKFSSADSALKLHVTYELSPDCTFLPQNGIAGFYLTNGVVQDVTSVHLSNVGAILIPVGGFVSIVVDPTKPLVISSILDGKS